ncbi:hypothetical protein VKT23_009373 [Stygiomarasmius scandens]|uniref:Uncharacterized protein n=1 Tax=Marasmiellus scandens TaxID=2682957 RepID=A0ABR1JI12_9AGAR
MPGPYGRVPQPASHRDSNALRASVLDVFVQLGALQKNSLITQWMFEEEGGSGMEQRGRQQFPMQEARYGAEKEAVRTVPEVREADAQHTETRRGGRSKFSKITAVFRGRSKSKTRAGKASPIPPEVPPPPSLPPSILRGDTTSTGYETDEGYNSSSPSTPGKRSKSRRRGISVFPVKSRPSESSEFSSRPTTPSEFSSRPSRDRSRAVSPTSDLSPPMPSISGGSSPGTKMFVSRKKDITVTSPENRARDEEWEQFPPLTPGAFAPSVMIGLEAQTGRGKASNSSTGGKSEKQEAGTLLKRLSFAIPRSNFQNPSKRKNRPPSLLPIMNPPEQDVVSRSLPPSPFILVTPEIGAAEFAGAPDTPYVLCTPVDDETSRARLSQPLRATDSPVYPLSVSKTLRRSLVLDNLNHSDEHLPLERTLDSDHLNVDTSRLNRALSMQGPSSFSQARVTFADDGQRRPGLRRSLSATQRAREAPFPMRPVLPIPLSLSIHGPNARAVRLSMDARASVIRQRYRSGFDADNQPEGRL